MPAFRRLSAPDSLLLERHHNKRPSRVTDEWRRQRLSHRSWQHILRTFLRLLYCTTLLFPHFQPKDSVFNLKSHSSSLKKRKRFSPVFSPERRNKKKEWMNSLANQQQMIKDGESMKRHRLSPQKNIKQTDWVRVWGCELQQLDLCCSRKERVEAITSIFLAVNQSNSLETKQPVETQTPHKKTSNVIIGYFNQKF